MDAEQEVSSRVNTQAVRRRKSITRRHADSLIASLDGGKYVDIQSEFTWSVPNLTDRQRLFIFYYTYPFDNSARGNGAKAAKLAGYYKRNYKVAAAKTLQNSDIQREINAFSLQITKKVTKANLETAVNAYIADKIKRTSVKPLDYYTFEERESDMGTKYTVAIPKLPTDLTEAQKAQILDVEYIGAKGLLHYKLPDRIATENEVIKLWRDLGGGVNNDKEAFEVETTAEIIKGNLTMKTRVMNANKHLADLSDMQDNIATERVEED